jgi:hypothetical protein
MPGVGGTGERAGVTKCSIDRYGLIDGVRTAARAAATAPSRDRSAPPGAHARPGLCA